MIFQSMKLRNFLIRIMKKILKQIQKIVRKRLIRLQLELQRFYQRKHLALHQMSISLFTKSCLQGYMDMLENWEIIISQKKNGFLMEHRFFMEVHQNFKQHLIMIFRRKRSLAIKTWAWKRLFIIWLFLYQDYGRYMYSAREIHELQQYSSLNI